MNFIPDCALPFLIVEVMIAEKNEVITKEVIAKILKSERDMPVPENVNGMPELMAAFPAPPSAEPRLLTTSIKTPDIANKNGAATTVANTMNIT